MDNEAMIKYKYILSRRFLKKLLRDGLITEQQFRNIERAVVKKLVEQV